MKKKKKCKCLGGVGNIINWEVPEEDHSQFGDMAKHMHICNVCGHAEWPEPAHSDAHDPASSRSGGNTAP